MTTSDEIEALQTRLRAEMAATDFAARLGARHEWCQAAWQCAQVALGKARAQRGTTRATALALCARIVAGNEVTIDELLRVTMSASHREFRARLCCTYCGDKLSRQRAAVFVGFESEALCEKCGSEINGGAS